MSEQCYCQDDWLCHHHAPPQTGTSGGSGDPFPPNQRRLTHKSLVPDELTALRAEVTRLREACENVLNTSTDFPVRAIARRALDTEGAT